jgi:hypothetical protein
MYTPKPEIPAIAASLCAQVEPNGFVFDSSPLKPAFHADQEGSADKLA